MRIRKLSMIFFIISLLLSFLCFATDPKELGIELYMRGLDAYQSGDYKTAQKLLEEAIKVYPDIESKAKDFKLIFGICAFYNGDYEKAKVYLSIYKDRNEIARKLLSEIPTNVKEDFLKHIELPKEPAEFIVSTSTLGTKSKSPGRNPLILRIGVFMVIFAGFLVMDLKLHIIERMSSKLPKIGKKEVERREIESEIEFEGSINEEMVEAPRSNEPLDVEELSNKEIGVVEDLLKLLEETENLGEKVLSIDKKLKKVEEDKKVETSEMTEEKDIIMSSPFSIERIRKVTEKLEEELKRQLKEKAEDEEGWVNAEEANLTIEEKLQQLDEKKDEYTKDDILKMLDLVLQAEGEKEE